MPLFAVIFVFYRRAGKPRPILITPRLCRSRYQNKYELPSIRRHQVKQLLLPARNTTDTYASICTRTIPGQRPGCRHATAGHDEAPMGLKLSTEGVIVRDYFFSAYSFQAAALYWSLRDLYIILRFFCNSLCLYLYFSHISCISWSSILALMFRLPT